MPALMFVLIIGFTLLLLLLVLVLQLVRSLLKRSVQIRPSLLTAFHRKPGYVDCTQTICIK